MIEIHIKDEYIKLGQAMKLAGLVSDGVQAKYEILSGAVLVNGEPDTRRGRKLYPQDVFSYQGQEVLVANRENG